MFKKINSVSPGLPRIPEPKIEMRVLCKRPRICFLFQQLSQGFQTIRLVLSYVEAWTISLSAEYSLSRVDGHILYFPISIFSDRSIAETESQAHFQGLQEFMQQVKENEGGTGTHKLIANCSNWLPSVSCYHF